MLAALLFGVAPRLRAVTSVPAFWLRDAARIGQSRRGRYFGNGLVISQIALSMALVASAALLVHYVRTLERVDLGFRPAHVLLVTVDSARAGYKPEQLKQTFRQLIWRLGAEPGVRAATLAAVTPISGAAAPRFVTVEGRSESPDMRHYVSLNWIAPRYFETLGTPIVSGRDFSFEDEGRPCVAIVNRAFLQRFFGGANAIGRRISLDPDPKPCEIIGVAADAKYSDVHEPPPETVYLNACQQRRVPSHFAISTAVAPESIAMEIQRAIHRELPAMPIASVATLSDQIDASIVPERIVASAAAAFGGLGALLAGLGLYGLIAYTVSQRVNEIGVRMALGATHGGVAVMVVRDAIRIVIVGLAFGIPLVFGGARVAATLFSGLHPDTSISLLSGVAALLVTSLAAAFTPAHRAARIDPMEALRHE